MQMFKKRVFSLEPEQFTYVNFAYSESGTSCGLEPSVLLYRNSVGDYFSTATLLATDINFQNLAPAGFYSEYDSDYGSIISREWNGTAFVGLPEICDEA